MGYIDSFEHAGLMQLRQAFFDEGVLAEPRLLTELERILPVARERWWRGRNELVSPPLPPEDPPLAEVVDWARTFHLDQTTDSWALRAATVTLQYWEAGSPRDRIGMPTSSFSSGPTPPFSFSFELRSYEETTGGAAPRLTCWPRGWHPLLESWSVFRRDVATQLREQLKSALAVYRREVETELQKAGYTPLPTKRTKHARKHLRWTALYQISGWSFADIARKELGSTADSAYDPKRRKIEDAVTRTAGLLGLTLRPARKGQVNRGGGARS